MASDPGIVNPQPERKSRRRRAGRGHLDLASAPSEEPTAQTEPPPESSQRRDPRARAKRPGASGARAAVRANGRVLLAVAFFVVGVVLVLLGWYGAANTNILTEQIPYLISGGLLGMALIIVAGVVASSASLERENREIRRDIGNALGSSPERIRTVGASPIRDRGSEDGLVFIVPGGRSFHLAGCPIVEGKDAQELTPDDAAEAGYSSCKLCGPD